MSTAPLPAAASSSETDAEWRSRHAWEAQGIAEADAELDAGLYVDATEVRAWIESMNSGDERPPPPTRHR